jgi:hypothetical protein
MKRVRLSIGKCLLIAALILPSVRVGLMAESYDLYSWKHEKDTYFCYSLQPASTSPVIAADLKASKNVVCGREQFKNQLISLPAGTEITWKQDESQGLTLPRPDVIRAIKGFAGQADVKFNGPESPVRAPTK